MAQFLKITTLTETSDQLLSLTLDSRPFILRIIWNERFGYFSLSILGADETPIVQNVKMVKNYPLVKRFSDIRLPKGDLYLIQDNGTTDRPNYEELGLSYNLYYFEPDKTATPDIVRQAASAAVIGTIWDSGLTSWDASGTSWDE